MDWFFDNRIHLWCEFKNIAGVKIQLVVLGQERKLTSIERDFLNQVAEEMNELKYIQIPNATKSKH